MGEGSKRWGKAQELCRLIEEAFSDVTLGSGVGLQEAQGLDDYEDAATLASYRAGDEKDDWHRIPAQELNRCQSSLSFFDAAGVRFHLPAYLLADLQDEIGQGMAFCLTYRPDAGQFALLSDAQRDAVRAYLLHISEEPSYACDHPEILKALDGFWKSSAIPQDIIDSPSTGDPQS